MRVTWLVPMLAVFGCAHPSGVTAQNTPPPEETTRPMASPPQEQAVAAAPAPKASPPTLACAPIQVHFAFDSSSIEASDEPLLDDAAKCLSQNQQQRVSIVGNADERGSTEYNLDLGHRRAEAVANYLEAKGASSNQVETVVSHGKDSPVCNEKSEDCYARNRRTAVRESCHM